MRIFDLHCDTVEHCTTNKLSMLQNDGQLDIGRGLPFALWVQTFACFLHSRYSGEEAYRQFLLQYQKLSDEIAASDGKMQHYSPANAPQSGVCNVVVSVEGGHALGGKIERIEELFLRKIRFFNLVWNGDNELGSGAKGSGNGLTAFGKACLAQLEKNNIVVDISHLNDVGIEDIIRLAQKPVVATHSNLRSVCGAERNLKDEYFQFLCACKGLCGINFYPQFLSGTPDSSFADFCRHLDRMLSLGGEDIVAIGSDFDGASMPTFINDIDGLYTLYDNVVKYYGERLAEKLFFENANNFYKRTFTK